MAIKLKPVDVVTVGVGLTGTILAKELADLGLKVVGLERGGWRDTHPDFDMPHAHDELFHLFRGRRPVVPHVRRRRDARDAVRLRRTQDVEGVARLPGGGPR